MICEVLSFAKCEFFSLRFDQLFTEHMNLSVFKKMSVNAQDAMLPRQAVLYWIICGLLISCTEPHTDTFRHAEDRPKSPTDSRRAGETRTHAHTRAHTHTGRKVMCEWVFLSESSGFVFQLSHSTVH